VGLTYFTPLSVAIKLNWPVVRKVAMKVNWLVVRKVVMKVNWPVVRKVTMVVRIRKVILCFKAGSVFQ
jgi:hypothetical protein